jgi:hypothetical protein
MTCRSALPIQEMNSRSANMYLRSDQSGCSGFSDIPAFWLFWPFQLSAVPAFRSFWHFSGCSVPVTKLKKGYAH